MNVIVLGAGLVGGPMARDLAADPRFEVTVADRDEEALARLAAPRLTTVRRDLADADAVTELVRGFDFVVGAVPGFLGFQTLRAVLEAGRDVVDIAFFPEDAFQLDDLARARGVTAIVDCGVMPGMGGALVARVARRLDEVETAVIQVGGLPEVRRWPWEYRAVFSPIDVIEEYTRPARYRENGALVVAPALANPELIDLPGVGTLEAFDTDGLRTLLDTIPARNLRERTLRYPGHIEKIRLLRECGFFSDQPVTVAGQTVRPLDLTARLLFPMWHLPAGEGDLTVMQVMVEGRKDGRTIRTTYDLLDRHDPITGVHSMARTTGYTATMALRLLAEGRYRNPGINPPEYLGRTPGCVSFLLAGLAERGVHYRERIEG